MPNDDDLLNVLKQALAALQYESSGYCGGEATEAALASLRQAIQTLESKP